MIEKEFIPYQQALELKKLGFDEPCLRVGNPNGHTMWKWIEVDGEPPTVSINDVIQVPYGEEWTQIPTYSQAFRFFREKYGYLVSPFQNENNLFFFEIGKLNTLKTEHYSKDWETYEDAEISCLVKLIDIIKNK